MKQYNFIALIIVTFFAVPVFGQSTDTACACAKFPYYYCTQNLGSTSIKVYCEDNPWNPSDVPQNPLGPTYPIRAASPFTCIERGVDADTLPPGENPGNMPGYGWIWDASAGTYIPGINIDNENYPSAGDYNVGTEMDGGGTTNYLAEHWKINLNLAFDTDWTTSSCVSTYDSSCCMSIVFQTDPQFYISRGFDPRTTAGYVDPLVSVNTQCEETCGDHTINVNVTDNFLYDLPLGDSIDWQNNPPTVLARAYVVDEWQNRIPSDKFDVGGWYNWNTHSWDNTDQTVHSLLTFDFCSIIMHEMGHWMGLPDRDAFCWNAGYCGNTGDSIYSLMGGTTPAGWPRQEFTPDDICWIRKLYCPESEPPCPTDAVSTNAQPLNIDLEQSQPNPTRGGADIGFTLDRSMIVTFNVYDILGKKLLTLVNNKFLDAGHHTVSVPADVLASGKYIYSLRTGGIVLSKVMTIVK